VIREQRQQQQRVRGSWLGDRETGDLGRFRFGGQFGAPLPEIAVAQPPRTGTTAVDASATSQPRSSDDDASPARTATSRSSTVARGAPSEYGSPSPSWRPRGRRDDEHGDDDDDEMDARSAWAATSRGGGRVPASTSSRAPSTAMSIIDRFRML
jgi:hypothetical protein